MSGAVQLQGVRRGVSRLSDADLHLFNEGTHNRLYDKLGAHPMTVDGVAGTYFAVWAPDAGGVWVVGDFNGWRPGAGNRLEPAGASGIWEGFSPGVGRGARYKFHVSSKHLGYSIDKTDPFAFFCEVPPATAGVVWDLDYGWNDGDWMRERSRRNGLDAPMAAYEVHLGSWRRVPEEGNRWLTYRELAHSLADYVSDMGFTHVELLPVMEHPFYGSCGYQTTGYFAPTSRYGTPQDFMYLVDHLHQDILRYPLHAGVQQWTRDLNRIYAAEPTLHELDCDPSGFEWVEPNDSHNSVISLIRKGRSSGDLFLVVANFTPVPRHAFLVGVPRGGFWQEVLNSDALDYGGSGVGNRGGVEALPHSVHGRPCSLELVLPPLGCLFFKSQDPQD